MLCTCMLSLLVAYLQKLRIGIRQMFLEPGYATSFTILRDIPIPWDMCHFGDCAVDFAAEGVLKSKHVSSRYLANEKNEA